MAEYSGNCHPCQTNQTEKYACLLRYENNARRQCYQTKLQEPMRNNLRPHTRKNMTANTKTCAVNNRCDESWIRKKKMEKKERSCDYITYISQ